jgi:hypothetical protein
VHVQSGLDPNCETGHYTVPPSFDYAPTGWTLWQGEATAPLPALPLLWSSPDPLVRPESRCDDCLLI